MSGVRSFLSALAHGLGAGLTRRRISSEAKLVEFVATRAAHVAQTALFGYLTTRMGTRAREIFQDPVFQGPLRTAQDSVFRDCATDLVVYCVGLIHRDGLASADCVVLARRLLTGALAHQGAGAPGQSAMARLDATDWDAATQGEAAFVDSPQGLIQAAPVIEGFKELDREIVMNSIRYRWMDVRRQARERIDGRAIFAGP